MIDQNDVKFGATSWWRDHPRTNLALMYAIRMLSGVDRTPEESWLAPTFDGWRRVADLAARYSDDGDLDLGGEQMPWQILSIVIGGAAPLDASGVRIGAMSEMRIG